MTSLHIVLVRTKYPKNIGSSARALQNMGGQKLILIDPQCNVNNDAYDGAAGAQAKLDQHIVYPHWKDFYKNESGLLIALTRREGKRRAVVDLEDQLSKALQVNPNVFQQPIYIILGPEDHGLSDNDMKHSHYRCSLPSFSSFGSMNLSHAALLALYICQNFRSKLQPMELPEENIQLDFPESTIQKWLEATGFQIGNRRVNAYSVLRRILLQNVPTESELSILSSILNQNIRKLEDKNIT